MVEPDISLYYQKPEVVQFYTKLVGIGLYHWEDELFKKCEPAKSCLIIGSGCGREAFALEQFGLRVYGVDSCLQQVNTAQSLAQSMQSQAKFFHSDALEIEPFLSQTVDLIWLTAGFTGHIPKRANRESFYRKLSIVGSCIIDFPDVFPRPWPREFAAIEEGAKNKIPDWESGDTFRQSFGPVKDQASYFYHFFSSQTEAEVEYRNAGWRPIDYTENGFIMKRNS